jgi:hypothetical protein
MNFIPKDRCHFLQIEDGASTPLVELKGKGKWVIGVRISPSKTRVQALYFN